MSVKIRLKRMGMKKKPFYRVVVADIHSPRDGRSIEEWPARRICSFQWMKRQFRR